MPIPRMNPAGYDVPIITTTYAENGKKSEGRPMARKEAALDLWVADRLTECDIEFTPLGSGIKDIENALKTASKCGTGRAGYPVFVNDREGYKRLEDIESFTWLSPNNIEEYYTRAVLDEPTDVEKTTEQILKDAVELHEYLRTYGSIKDQDKALVVAGILLVLDEVEYGGFSIASLTGDQTEGMRDGDKLMNAIRGRLTRSNVGPDVKKNKLLSEFKNNSPTWISISRCIHRASSTLSARHTLSSAHTSRSPASTYTRSKR